MSLLKFTTCVTIHVGVLVQENNALQCPRVHLVILNQHKNNTILPAVVNESHI